MKTKREGLRATLLGLVPIAAPGLALSVLLASTAQAADQPTGTFVTKEVTCKTKCGGSEISVHISRAYRLYTDGDKRLTNAIQKSFAQGGATNDVVQACERSHQGWGEIRCEVTK